MEERGLSPLARARLKLLAGPNDQEIVARVEFLAVCTDADRNRVERRTDMDARCDEPMVFTYGLNTGL